MDCEAFLYPPKKFNFGFSKEANSRSTSSEVERHFKSLHSNTFFNS